MRTVQSGDSVRVHYVKRFQDGSVASSRGRAPIELTVGIDHPRLRGLGLALVGLAPGASATVHVPAEPALPSAPPRVHRWARTRFSEDQVLQPGKWVRILSRRGRRRLVRILEVRARIVVVDTNHRRAGQALNLEVELIAIRDQMGSGIPDPRPAAEDQLLPVRGRVVGFDLDAASLVSLREALPGWEIDRVDGASAASLSRAWNPGAADLLVVGSRDSATNTLGLCRFLAFCAPYSGDSRFEPAEARAQLGNAGRRADAPLLVLVLPGEETLGGATLDAGAHSFLVLPIHPKEVASMLTHARAGNQPGRHTLGQEGAQREDPWRDAGGEA